MVLSRNFHKLLQIQTYIRNLVICHVRYVNMSCLFTPQNRGYITPSQQFINRAMLREKSNANNNSSSNSIPKRSVIDYKLVKLCQDIRTGRVSYNDLEQIVTFYENTDSALHHSTTILLLKCCGSLLPDTQLDVRHDLAMRIWDLLKRKNCNLTLEYYSTLLDIYEDNLQTIDPNQFLQDINDVEPNQEIYESLLHVVANTGNPALVTNIIHKMKEENYVLNENVFSALIKAQALQGRFEEIGDTVKNMNKLGIKDFPKIYAQLAHAFALQGNISETMSALQFYQPSTATVMKVVKALNSSGKDMYIPEVLKCLKTPIEEPHLIRNAIVEFMYSGKIETASLLTLNIPTSANEDMESKLQYINCFLTELITLDQPVNNILKIVLEIVTPENCWYILNNAAKNALYRGKEMLTLKLFEIMKEKSVPVRPHYYWPLFVLAQRNEGEAKILSLIKRMTSLNVQVSSDTLTDYVFPYIYTVDPVISVKRLHANGVPYSSLFTPFLIFLLRNKRLQDCVSLCSKMQIKINHREILKPLAQEYMRTKDIQSCLFLLQQPSVLKRQLITHFIIALICNENNENDHVTVSDLVDILKLLKEKNVQISDIDAEKLIYQTKKICVDESEHTVLEGLITGISSDKISTSGMISVLTHPREMETSELMHHVIELKSKGFNIRGALRKLLQKHCTDNNIDRAIETAREFDEHNFEWTAGMKSSLFDLYIRNNMPEKAEEVLNEILTLFPSFPIDKYKILNFATVLVKNGKLDTAFDVIEKSDSSKQGKVLKNCRTLLQEIARNADVDSAKKMLQLLVEKGYCKVNKFLLSCILETYLSRNDITSALNMFKESVQTYRCTLLERELITVLLKSSMDVQSISQELQNIYRNMKKIHGSVYANIMVALALAAVDETERLKQALQVSQLSINALTNYMEENVSPEERISILMAIMKIGKDVTTIDMNSLCDALLSAYIDIGDCEGCVKLWQRMETERIKPTEQFRAKMLAFLRSHKRTVPSGIEENYKNGLS